MNRILTIIGLLFALSTQQVLAQCDFSINVNTADFEYTVDIDLNVTDILFSQQGNSCNVRLELTYDIDINVVTAPPWWNGSLYTLQGTVDCIGASGASFFNLPNDGGTGTITSATFTLASTECANAFFDCPINIEIGGPDLNSNESCGLFSGLNPLPVVLSDFSYVKKESGGFDLRWATETELDFSHFELEMTKDFENWDQVGTVLGENSRLGAAYDYPVTVSGEGNYVRLKMVDIDDSFEYSDVLYLPNTSKQAVSVYPNPVADILHLNGMNTQDVIIYNAFGQRVLIPGHSDQALDVSGLQPGHYVLRFRQSTSEQAPIRFVKM